MLTFMLLTIRTQVLFPGVCYKFITSGFYFHLSELRAHLGLFQPLTYYLHRCQADLEQYTGKCCPVNMQQDRSIFMLIEVAKGFKYSKY